MRRCVLVGERWRELSFYISHSFILDCRRKRGKTTKQSTLELVPITEWSRLQYQASLWFVFCEREEGTEGLLENSL
jgi:hypothetical protein